MRESRDSGGKCTDLNGLYVGLARGAGLPARDVYGIRVARSEVGYMHDRVVMVARDKMFRLLLPSIGCSRIVKRMILTREHQRTAQICCLCCAYVSSGTGRLVN
jgi:hypothetical protein